MFKKQEEGKLQSLLILLQEQFNIVFLYYITLYTLYVTLYYIT